MFEREISTVESRTACPVRHSYGFTLIELMVTISIVAILASLAIASYRAYVVRSHLVEAMDVLSGLQIQMEHFYQDTGSYAGPNGCGVAPPASVSSYFTYTCVVPDGPGQQYAFTATGVGMTAGYIYTVDDSPTPRKTSMFAGNPQTGKTCWLVKADDC